MHASPFSKAQRCAISYLGAKPNIYFEEKKKVTKSQMSVRRVSPRLHTRALGPPWAANT